MTEKDKKLLELYKKRDFYSNLLSKIDDPLDIGFGVNLSKSSKITFLSCSIEQTKRLLSNVFPRNKSYKLFYATWKVLGSRVLDVHKVHPNASPKIYSSKKGIYFFREGKKRVITPSMEEFFKLIEEKHLNFLYDRWYSHLTDEELFRFRDLTYKIYGELWDNTSKN